MIVTVVDVCVLVVVCCVLCVVRLLWYVVIYVLFRACRLLRSGCWLLVVVVL